jgi:hypothetical protein
MYEFQSQGPPAGRLTLDPVTHERKIKACQFIERDMLVICSGDNGCAYLCEAESGEILQELRHHGSKCDVYVHSWYWYSISCNPGRFPIQTIAVSKVYGAWNELIFVPELVQKSITGVC